MIRPFLIPFAATIFFMAVSAFAQTEVPPPGYKLVWSDEFGGASLDMSKWDYRRLGKDNGGKNVKEAVSLDGRGNLVLTASKVGDEYHSAMIGTQNKYEFLYGYCEARVQLQSQEGLVSAFWLQSPTIGNPMDDPATAGSEIDIYEWFTKWQDHVQHAVHWGGYKAGHKMTSGGGKTKGVGVGFHTFGVLWTPTDYTFYIDGAKTWQTDKSVSHRTEYIILDLAVWSWGGDIKKATLPDKLTVDYVRVYQTPMPAAPIAESAR